MFQKVDLLSSDAFQNNFRPQIYLLGIYFDNK